MNFVGDILTRIHQWLNRGLAVLITLGMLLIFVTVFGSVIARYVLHVAAAYLDTLASWSVIMMVFVGAAVIAYQRNHIKVEVLHLFLHNKRARTIIDWYLNLALLVMSIYFAYIGWGYMMYTWSLSAYAAALPAVHMGWIKSLPFIGGVLWSINFAFIVVKDGIDLMKKHNQST